MTQLISNAPIEISLKTSTHFNLSPPTSIKLPRSGRIPTPCMSEPPTTREGRVYAELSDFHLKLTDSIVYYTIPDLSPYRLNTTTTSDCSRCWYLWTRESLLCYGQQNIQN